jgi:hypothetical protein
LVNKTTNTTWSKWKHGAWEKRANLN